MNFCIKTKMLECNACSTPMVSTAKLYRLDSLPFDDASFYKSVVGTLQYLTISRPDIAFGVNKLSQFLHSSTVAHWNACNRVLRYLKGTMSLALHFDAASTFHMEGFSYADWASCVDDRRSTGGHCVFIRGNLIVWSAKKHEVIARSSAESKYRSLANLTTDVVYYKLCAERLAFQL